MLTNNCCTCTASRAGCWLRPQSYRRHMLILSTAPRIASNNVSCGGCGSVIAHPQLSCFSRDKFLIFGVKGRQREEGLGTRLQTFHSLCAWGRQYDDLISYQQSQAGYMPLSLLPATTCQGRNHQEQFHFWDWQELEMSSGCDTMYRFIHPPSDVLGCVICLDEVASDPWQHDKCGKLFCKKCLKEYGGKKPCPHCRKDQPRYFEDTRGKRLLEYRGLEIAR